MLSMHEVTTRNDGLDKRKFSRTIMWTEQRSYSPQANQHRQWASSTSDKISINFWSLLQCCKWGKINRYLSFKAITRNLQFRYSRLHTRNIFSCPECLNSQKVAFRFRRQCLYVEFPSSVAEYAQLQFVIGKSSTSSILCCFFNSFFTSLTFFRHGTAFCTPHKQTLQADYRRLLDLKFLDE